MIKSMTGFAQTIYGDKNLQMTVAVRTYNNRFLDINLRLNNALFPLEERIKTYVASRVFRGRVELSIQLASQEKLKNGNISINWPLAQKYAGLLSELKKKLNIPGPPALSDFLTLKDLIICQESTFSEESLWHKLVPTLKKVFDALHKMRSEEGRNLEKDLLERVKAIHEGVAFIDRKIPGVVEGYQVRLKERINKMARGVEVDPLRLAQEVAILADRSDISEEVIRLRSHLKQFKALFKEVQPVGKKMEFLLQEMNREINTIGSKSMESTISHQVVSIKAEFEKIREQIQNIE